MVYNPEPGGADAVRETTGNLLPEDFPDTSIIRNIEESYDWIQGMLELELNQPLVAGVRGSFLARRLERRDAARESLKAYGDEFLEKIKELDREIRVDIIDLQKILDVEPEEAAEEDDFQKTGHKNWNENADTPVPNRLKGSSSTDIEGVPRIDPDLNM